MDIRVYVATHKNYKMPQEKMYIPLHVGREGKNDLGYLGDNTGDNISIKNSNYCELTGLYWVYKNIDCEYIGLSHYRRYFTVKPLVNRVLSKDDKFSLILKEEEALQLLKDADIVLPSKRNYYIETVESHYKNAHHIEDLNKVREIIKEYHSEYTESFNEVMGGKKLYLYNMFIMKKKDFDEYCKWLFDILFKLESQIDISNYDNYQSRIFGFLSERLFNVWIRKNNLRIKEIPVINMEGINWWNKGISFLKRKFIK